MKSIFLKFDQLKKALDELQKSSACGYVFYAETDGSNRADDLLRDIVQAAYSKEPFELTGAISRAKRYLEDNK